DHRAVCRAGSGRRAPVGVPRVRGIRDPGHHVRRWRPRRRVGRDLRDHRRLRDRPAQRRGRRGRPLRGRLSGAEVRAMSRSISIPTSGAALGLLLGLASCDLPECIQGPSNLTPETTAACAAPPEDTTPEAAIQSAGAELRDDGTLVLTLSSMGLACGTEALDIAPPDDCRIDGWAFTIEIPPELAVPGVIT